MKKTTIEQLNSAAMQIILHAGDCRNLLNEAVNALLEDKSEEDIKAKITAAKKEITKAHVIQTEMIQSSINEDELQTTLLFTCTGYTDDHQQRGQLNTEYDTSV